MFSSLEETKKEKTFCYCLFKKHFVIVFSSTSKLEKFKRKSFSFIFFLFLSTPFSLKKLKTTNLFYFFITFIHFLLLS